nr:MAG TPA: hypothetical protein [Caudoviricetes sp.]
MSPHGTISTHLMNSHAVLKLVLLPMKSLGKSR